ncbi:MAG: hypothetical protein AAF790_07595 [Planctomycetota bacterium]
MRFQPGVCLLSQLSRKLTARLAAKLHGGDWGSNAALYVEPPREGVGGQRLAESLARPLV